MHACHSRQSMLRLQYRLVLGIHLVCNRQPVPLASLVLLEKLLQRWRTALTQDQLKPLRCY